MTILMSHYTALGTSLSFDYIVSILPSTSTPYLSKCYNKFTQQQCHMAK